LRVEKRAQIWSHVDATKGALACSRSPSQEQKSESRTPRWWRSDTHTRLPAEQTHHQEGDADGDDAELQRQNGAHDEKKGIATAARERSVAAEGDAFEPAAQMPATLPNTAAIRVES